MNTTENNKLIVEFIKWYNENGAKKIKNRKKMETQTYFRCYFSNDMYKVGNVITEKEFNRVPTEYKGDFKPHKQE